MAKPPKKSRARKKYEKKHNKDLNKNLRKQRERAKLRPNAYPKTQLILIRDFLRSTDLIKAVIYFLFAQGSLFLVSAGLRLPHIAGALSLLSFIMGLTLILFAFREINNRQRADDTRRPVKKATVFKTALVMVILLFLVNNLLATLNMHLVPQPNQESISLLSSQFPIIMFFVVAIVSPIIEELVFRELLPYATGPSYLTFFISSVLFVALHSPSGLAGWVSYAVLSGGFLFARLKDNNVYTAIIVHILWNALSLLL